MILRIQVGYRLSTSSKWEDLGACLEAAIEDQVYLERFFGCGEGCGFNMILVGFA